MARVGIRIALSIACFAAACSRGDSTSGAAGLASRQSVGDAAGSPVSGGTLVFAFDGAAITEFDLDPHKSGFAPHHRIIRSIFDSLVVALPNHRFGPWLARSWDVAAD